MAIGTAPQDRTETTGASLRGEGLTLGYQGDPVLTDVDVELPAARVTALVGANGSGKSTLLRTLARLHSPRQGTIRLNDTDIASFGPRAFAREVAMLAQVTLTPDAATVREMVELGRYPHQGLLGRMRGTDRDAVDWAIEVTSLAEFVDRGMTQLSGGERQRVWIAMALAQQAQVLLLDEPTTFLDIRHQVEVLDLMRSLADEHGITIGAVLHDLNQAAAWSDQVVVVSDGRVLSAGSPIDVLTAEVVGNAFGMEISVVADPETGLPTCLPFRRAGAGAGGARRPQAPN